MSRELAGQPGGPVEEPPEALVDEPEDEHAWHLGIGAPTVRTWPVTEADGEEPAAEASGLPHPTTLRVVGAPGPSGRAAGARGAEARLGLAGADGGREPLEEDR
jgi:hypothetical protein